MATPQSVEEVKTTFTKAREINLNPTFYGTFAEIGAGQEVASNFFKAGYASGTIAKTISAYDMQFSDNLYGKSKLYVSYERLESILDKEYKILYRTLPNRQGKTCFFVFASTAKTSNYKTGQNGHAWLGIRFLHIPTASEYSECIIHLNSKEVNTFRQREAIGTTGVNLIYASLKGWHDPDRIIKTLRENVPQKELLEIDSMRLTGPAFAHYDNRLITLRLVQESLTPIAMFNPQGHVVQCTEDLYKKNILILRGVFRPFTNVHKNMLNSAKEKFIAELNDDKETVRQIAEINVQTGNELDITNEKDFLDRVKILCKLNYHVIVSSFKEHYKLVSYLSQSAEHKEVRITLGTPTLSHIFNAIHYNQVEGGILEALGRLFNRKLKLYIYPYKYDNGTIETTKTFTPKDKTIKGLFEYLIQNNKIIDIPHLNESITLDIQSDEILNKIKDKNSQEWEKYLPDIVVEEIKSKHLFEYTD